MGFVSHGQHRPGDLPYDGAKAPHSIDGQAQKPPHSGRNFRGDSMLKLKTILLGDAAAIALCSAAVAADVPVRGPVYTKAPVAEWSWEGQYIGIHGGYFDGTNDVFSPGPFPFSPRGGFGGLQFGYLHHLSRNWLIGYEVDVSFGGVDSATGGVTHDINVFGTARTRLGYAQGPWLFYGTAGVAWAHTEFSNNVGTSVERPQVGYAVGAGVEYALTRNWSARFEYLYLDLGTTNSTGVFLSSDLTASTFRLGLNYRFANWNPSSAQAYPVQAPVRHAGWTGPYIGIHGGYGFGDYDVSGIFTATAEPKGGFFGIQSGYNWQLSQNWVFGVEGDSAWGSISHTNGTTRADIDATGTVRARFGYANGHTLYYATGGLAWIHADTVAAGITTRDQFWLGWTAGAGIEYALSQKWSAKVEYLYADFGVRDVIGGATLRDDFSVHTIKLGVNYRAGVFDLLFNR